MPTRHSKLFSGALALSLCLFFGTQACFAESRTAGRIYVAPKKEAKQEELSTGNSVKISYTSPDEKVDYIDLESYGLLSRAADGALGKDVWRGSKHSELVQYIPQLPSLSEYSTLQPLTLRLLLTKNDAGLLRYDKSVTPGEDLTTIRIEKLLEMGAYKEAFGLYSQRFGLPYHERFARAGILAALYNKEPALGCLDVKAMQQEGKEPEGEFWLQVNEICDYFLTGKNKSLKHIESKIIQSIIKKDSYRFKPSKPEDFQDFTPMEMAVLTAAGRVDLSGIEINGDDALPPHVIALFLQEKSLPESQLFKLMLQAVKLGVRQSSDLEGFYKEMAEKHFGKNTAGTSLLGYEKLTDWKRLPYLYRALTNAESDKEKNAIALKALGLMNKYDSAAFWPMAPYIARIVPENIDVYMINRGFAVLVETGSKVSKEWFDTWFALNSDSKKSDKNAVFEYLALEIADTNHDFLINEDTENKQYFSEIDPKKEQIAKIIYEKLDKKWELHNYSGDSAYEKHPDLTSDVDYVMPSIGLMEHLREAVQDQRLGEVVLLSSIALRDVPPEDLSEGLVREVMAGFTTVGLTKEAQNLAREIVLSFSENKKGEK